MLALARHFFQDFFRLSFLDDAGEESFRRVILGILAAFLALGLWMPRVLAVKYGAAHPTIDTYQIVLWSDQLMMIALPMFLVALATALVSHSLFPDELDFRILMALPVSRATVFAAKLLALLIFAALFVITTNVALSVPFSVISRSEWGVHYWPVRAAALTLAGVCGSIFGFGAIVAIQGLVVLLSPRDWLRNVSVVTQTALVCMLVLVLPLVFRSGAQAQAMKAQSMSVLLAPPVWFLGLHEVLLGQQSPYTWTLAACAAGSLVVVVLITAVCYVVAYRRFDQAIVRSQGIQRVRPGATRCDQVRPGATGCDGPYMAVVTFTTKTLRRSGLHQLVFLGTGAAGLALAINAVLAAGTPRELILALQWGPFPLMFATVLGLHAALLLPVMRRAAWVFRLTETDQWRAGQIAGAERVMIVYGVLVPIAFVLPVHVGVFGWRDALVGAPVMAAMGLTAVELRLLRWHRIPFTCSYMPGKRPVAHTVLLLVTGFGVFTFVGFGLMGRTMTTGWPPLMPLVIMAGLAGAARWVRVQMGHSPLEFEDELPESSYGLRLNT